MPPTYPSAPGRAGAATDRVRLAELALAAALKVDGVVAPAAPPEGEASTRGSGRRIDGVTVVAAREERYDVSLHLVARVTPLRPLAERVRERVSGAARRSGLADRLGPVAVRFEDLAEEHEAPGAAVVR